MKAWGLVRYVALWARQADVRRSKANNTDETPIARQNRSSRSGRKALLRCFLISVINGDDGAKRWRMNGLFLMAKTGVEFFFLKLRCGSRRAECAIASLLFWGLSVSKFYNKTYATYVGTHESLSQWKILEPTYRFRKYLWMGRARLRQTFCWQNLATTTDVISNSQCHKVLQGVVLARNGTPTPIYSKWTFDI